MKTIGIIGGMSWESSAEYYKLINQEVVMRLGAQQSARIMLFSVDYNDIEELISQDDWVRLAELIVDTAQAVEKSGAEIVLLASNTMHKVADEVQQRVNIPVLHIADALGQRIQRHQIKKVGLIGSQFVMREGFFSKRLTDRFDVEVLTPTETECAEVHRVIFDELVVGELKDESRKYFVRIINELKALGAEAIVLGSTEIPVLLAQEESPLPILDTTSIHAQAAVSLSLKP